MRGAHPAVLFEGLKDLPAPVTVFGVAGGAPQQEQRLDRLSRSRLCSAPMIMTSLNRTNSGASPAARQGSVLFRALCENFVTAAAGGRAWSLGAQCFIAAAVQSTHEGSDSSSLSPQQATCMQSARGLRAGSGQMYGGVHVLVL